MARIGVIALLIIILSFAASVLSASVNQSLYTDLVREALSLPDGAEISLPGIFVTDVVLPYAFSTDLYGHGPHPVLPIFLGKFLVGDNYSLNVRGILTTLGEDRVLIASDIKIYTNPDGTPLEHPFPCRALPWDYVVPADTASLASSPTTTDPGALPPIIKPEPKPIVPILARAGTVASAKVGQPVVAQSPSTMGIMSTPPQLAESGQIEIADRPVTAVYHDLSGNVLFFYIQENIVGGNGIKCVPAVTTPVEPGSIVTVKGSVEVVAGEAQITVNSVKCTSSTVRPRPIGLNNRATAGGAFGIQPALYLKTSDTSPGSGLSAVGTRARVWGSILATSTEGGHAVYWISDGTGLSTTAHNGLKIIYWNPNDAPTGQTYISVTGVLGAEMVDNKAVPVVRVPESTPWEVPSGVKYVTPNGVSIGSWTNCYSSLQSAINAAALENPVAEVWVAAGTYAGITLADGVAVYGGFAGGETLREQRNWSAHSTILNTTGTVISISGCTSPGTRIDGFTITGATNGGIQCYSSNPVIANNTITGNTYWYYGGGISCTESSPLIWNNTISGNTSSYGGAGISCDNSSPLILSNTITDNSTNGVGGGICCSNSSAPVVQNNDILTNSANSSGGGVYCVSYTSAKISGNTINGNSVSSGDGGGICCNTNDASTISRNTISGNSASSYYGALGGGIACRTTSTVISNNIISGNSTDNGGGIGCDYDGNLPLCIRMVSNAIVNNTSRVNGAGIFSNAMSCDITNNTVAWNNKETTGTGDGIYLSGYNTSFTLCNNIVAYNYGAGIHGESGIAYTVEKNNVHGQDTYGNYVGVTSPTPVTGAPFADDPTHDIHITGQPCKDAGLNSVVKPGDADIDDEYRIMDNTVDIGADEVTGCVGYDISTSPSPAVAAVNGTAHVCVTLSHLVSGAPVTGKQVNLSIDDGEITAISPDGSINQGGLSGYGVTGLDGKVYADVTYNAEGYVNLTVTVTVCGQDKEQTAHIWFFATAPEDWPMFMHDAQHTGMSRTWDDSPETLTREWVVDLPTATTTRTNEAWLFTVDSTTYHHPNPSGNAFIFEHPYIDSSPVVVGKRVIVGTWNGDHNYPNATGSVKSFNAETGSSDSPYGWTAAGNPTMGGVASTACVSDGRVYIGTTNGYLYCLNLSDGTQVWARPTYNRSGNLSRIISSPVVHNGVVYITNETSKVYAFSADEYGTRIWSDEPGQPHDYLPVTLPINTHGVTRTEDQTICGVSSPAIATVGENTYLLVGCDDGYVYRIKISDRTMAELFVGGCVESSPTVSGNYAYVGVSIYQGKNLRRLTIEPFEEIASWSLLEESRATVSLAYDFAFNGVDTGDKFYKLDANHRGPGSEYLARFGAPEERDYFVGSAAHTTGGVVYTGNDNGRFYALDADALHSLVILMDGTKGYYDTSIQMKSFVCSSPAIGYNVESNHYRWVFITTRSDGGKLYAFKTIR